MARMFFPELFATRVRLFGKTSVCRRHKRIRHHTPSCCCATPTIFRKRFLNWSVECGKIIAATRDTRRHRWGMPCHPPVGK